jgi:hypothetical protein
MDRMSAAVLFTAFYRRFAMLPDLNRPAAHCESVSGIKEKWHLQRLNPA